MVVQNYVPIVVPGLSTGSSSSTTSTSPTSLPQNLTVGDSTPSPATIRRRSTRSRVWGNQLHDSEQTEDETEDIDFVLRNRLQDLPEWLEDFTESPLDEGVSALRNTPASTSRESDQELSRKVVSDKRSIFTHFPKDRHCEVISQDQNYKCSLQKSHW